MSLYNNDTDATPAVYLSSGDSNTPAKIQTTGILNPINTCSTIKLSGGAFDMSNSYVSFPGAMVFLSYKGTSLESGGLLYSYSDNDPVNNFHIRSTNTDDSNYVNYMIVTNDPANNCEL